jgi:L-ascorbate metabolism protein UlaG (beta-lactamase superfamily)
MNTQTVSKRGVLRVHALASKHSKVRHNERSSSQQTLRPACACIGIQAFYKKCVIINTPAASKRGVLHVHALASKHSKVRHNERSSSEQTRRPVFACIGIQARKPCIKNYKG